MKKFQIGKTYFTRSVCDHECIFRITIASRTEKTIVTTENKRLRVSTKYTGDCEQVWPHGKYSMAPVINADSEE